MVQGMGEKRVDFCFLYHPHPYDTDPGSQVGLGMLLLATYAKKLGASVRVINAQTTSIEEAIQLVPECRFLMLYGCLIDKPILKDVIAGTLTKIKICTIIGGPIAISPFHTDYAVFIDGFGEDVVSCLVNSEIESKDTSYLKHSVNYYPFPDRTLIEGSKGGNIFKRDGSRCQESTTLLTSRGCKYHCAFCMSGNNSFYEDYSLERIGQELEHCLSLGIRNIRISDDNILADKRRLESLCVMLKEAKVKWRASIRSYPNDQALYEMMADAGCEELSFGVESGDQSVLNLLRKGMLTSQNTQAIRNAKKAGILTRALMMMGTPGETRNTLYLNMGWVEVAQPDMVSLKIFIPYPGTDIFIRPDKYRCILHLPLANVNNSAYRPDDSEPVANIDTEELNRDQLTDQFQKMKSFLESKGIENRGK